MGKRGPKKGNPYKYTKEFIEKEADALLEYARTHEGIPFLCEFAPKRGYSEYRLCEWARENNKLSQAIKELKSIQKHKLMVLSLANKVNPHIAALILKCNHGFVEKQALEHSGQIKGEGTKIVIVRPNDSEDKTKTVSRQVSVQ